ncbi:hypothetical protein CAC42_4355 [Sphaceloma murrayae]|uniref:4-amino-5-hydroxymethyl-2-methylpyrimidine phosphate synthase n=1 Tax=Sphaceloma murrayae TaxID=2082308 RepID=A0A2K1QLD4_9PEZI|nr:hypothetical protein CAC42_4355 [Sphaceloma murrayae]
MAPPATIRVALDWTPNTLHSGLYVAQAKDFYTTAGLAVTLLPPSPEYTTTPARLVASHDADLAVCPSESCLAYAESGTLSLQAIYAICQRDASAIVTGSPSASLKDLGAGVYGSYNARYEDAIVRSMVDAAGGDGRAMKIEAAKGKLTLFDEVGAGGVDATWVFLPWEGVEAEMQGRELGVYRPGDFGVPYGYSPVIARDAKGGEVSAEALKAFVRETARGYQFCVAHPDEAAEIMAKVVQGREKEFLKKSQVAINEYYGGATAFSLGQMDGKKWDEWVAWLREKGLFKKDDVNMKNLFTNQFFNQCMLLEED